MAEQGQGGIKFSLGPGGAIGGPSGYCNNAQVLSSLWDFTLEFAQLVPTEQVGEDGARMPALVGVGRIIMSPQHAKAFSRALARSVEQWENEFGEIPTLPEQPQ